MLKGLEVSPALPYGNSSQAFPLLPRRVRWIQTCITKSMKQQALPKWSETLNNPVGNYGMLTQGQDRWRYQLARNGVVLSTLLPLSRMNYRKRPMIKDSSYQHIP